MKIIAHFIGRVLRHHTETQKTSKPKRLGLFVLLMAVLAAPAHATTLSPVLDNGASRLTELLTHAGNETAKRSSLKLKFAFADTQLQQVSNYGAARAIGEALNEKADTALTDGWSVWSRGEVSVGSLKAVKSGDKVDTEPF
jgi:hypothetical protein